MNELDLVKEWLCGEMKRCQVVGKGECSGLTEGLPLSEGKAESVGMGTNCICYHFMIPRALETGQASFSFLH